MNRFYVVLALAAFVVLPGCQMSSYSKNMRTATVQATATVGVKAVLDECALDSYDVTKKSVMDMAASLNKFMDDGRIGDLPLDKAKEAVIKFMTEKGWSAYIGLVISVFDMVASQQLPVDKIGLDNVAMIKYGLDAALVSAASSRAEWRRPPVAQDSSASSRSVRKSSAPKAYSIKIKVSAH